MLNLSELFIKNNFLYLDKNGKAYMDTLPPHQPVNKQANPLRNIPLFKRFPRIHQARRQDHLVKPEDRNKYPAFADDFKTLDEVLIPIFRDFDNEALANQNAYRGMYVILILGGALVTILGILQIAFIDTTGIGIAGSVVALVLGGVTTLSSRFNYQKRYFNARLRAERLRHEYFLFLGRIDQYDDQARLQKLKTKVADIEAEEEALSEAEDERRSYRSQGGSSISQRNDKQFFELYQEHRFKDQLCFYKGAQKEFNCAKTEAVYGSITLIFLAGVAGIVASSVAIPWLKLLFLLLAAIFPIISTALAGYITLYGFEQQAKLYQDAIIKLHRAPVPQDNLAESEFARQLNDYVLKVEEIFQKEQDQWGQLAEHMKPPET